MRGEVRERAERESTSWASAAAHRETSLVMGRLAVEEGAPVMVEAMLMVMLLMTLMGKISSCLILSSCRPFHEFPPSDPIGSEAHTHSGRARFTLFGDCRVW